MALAARYSDTCACTRSGSYRRAAFEIVRHKMAVATQRPGARTCSDARTGDVNHREACASFRRPAAAG